MNRDRACGALIVGSKILMVEHHEDGKRYWTLPGGGVEPGESPEECASREVFEETGLRTIAADMLWSAAAARGTEFCFLMKLEQIGSSFCALVGFDPEEGELPLEDRTLQRVAWRPIIELQHDRQISKVLAALV